MMGASAFILGIVGLCVVFGKDAVENAKVKEMNKGWENDRAIHKYNKKMQDELERADIRKLEELSGMDIMKLSYSKRGDCTLGYSAAKCTMIKRIMTKRGYDYEPKHDTWFHEKYIVPRGYASYKGTPFEGL